MKTSEQVTERRDKLEATSNVVLVLAGIIPEPSWVQAIDRISNAAEALSWVLGQSGKADDYAEQNRIILGWLAGDDYSDLFAEGLVAKNVLLFAMEATVKANEARMALSEKMTTLDKGISA